MFACIHIPDFPVEAIVRAEPQLRERAVAVLDGKPPQVRVIALDEKARQMGMETGMTKLDAAIFAEPGSAVPAAAGKATRPSGHIDLSRQTAKLTQPAKSKWGGAALLRLRSREQEKSAHAALLDIAHAFTPRVEDTADDRLLLDLSGLERLHGSAAQMGRELAARISRVGVEASIGIAANPDSAMHAACGFGGITIISAGEEGRRLGVLPLQVLLDALDLPGPKKANLAAAQREHKKLREQVLDTLERWGVRDFRTLALLPEHALASRLGEVGARLQRMARGTEMRTLALCEAETFFEEALELESAVESLEPLSFVMNRLLEQLCARLESRALAAHEIQIRLKLERRVADEATTTMRELAGESHNVGVRSMFERTLHLPVAMRDAKIFLKLLQLELAAHPPGAPILKLWIAAKPAPPRSAQRGLFLPLTPEAEKLEITLARISAIVGERRAGSARLLDTHRPDSFAMERFSTPEEPADPAATLTTSDSDETAPLVLRIFRPARPLRVRTSGARPAAIAEMNPDADRGILQGKILWSAGPWRSSGEWWEEQAQEEKVQKGSDPWDREEWDIALANESDSSVALYRIYRDLGSDVWFAYASYD